MFLNAHGLKHNVCLNFKKSPYTSHKADLYFLASQPDTSLHTVVARPPI